MIKKEIHNIEEKAEDFLDEKKNKNILGIVGYSLLAIILLIIFICTIFGVVNYNKVKNNEEPNGYSKSFEYVNESKTVTVYEYFIYKLVKVKDDKQTAISLKLWFLKDIK